jgi:hypothetical protein
MLQKRKILNADSAINTKCYKLNRIYDLDRNANRNGHWGNGGQFLLSYCTEALRAPRSIGVFNVWW